MPGFRFDSTTMTPAAACVVKEIIRQQNHAVDKVPVDEPLTDVALPVLVLTTGATRCRARV